MSYIDELMVNHTQVVIKNAAQTSAGILWPITISLGWYYDMQIGLMLWLRVTGKDPRFVNSNISHRTPVKNLMHVCFPTWDIKSTCHICPPKADCGTVTCLSLFWLAPYIAHDLILQIPPLSPTLIFNRQRGQCCSIKCTSSIQTGKQFPKVGS